MFEDMEINPMAVFFAILAAGIAAVMIKYTGNSGVSIKWWVKILGPIFTFIAAYMVVSFQLRD